MLLSRKQVADRLHRSYATVRRMERRGQIRVAKYNGRQPLFREEEVERVARELHVASRTVEELQRERDRLEAELQRVREELHRERVLLDRLTRVIGASPVRLVPAS
jgi:excisionase family DNA binding protein